MARLFEDMLMGPLANVLRTAVLGVLAYVALVLVLRASGKRTLAKLNAFDFIVTVALGSSLATVLLSKDVSLLQGSTAFGVLAGMQYLVAWMSVRSKRFSHLVRSSPTLVYYRGAPLEEALRKERLTIQELRAAVRSQGIEQMDSVDAIVLESDGTLSVLRGSAADSRSSLEGVSMGKAAAA